VEEACDVNHLIRPVPIPSFSALCMLPAELILEENTASCCSPKAFHASLSSPPISPQRRRATLACSTYVLQTPHSPSPPSLSRIPVLHSRRHARQSIVCRRECVLDFCRDPTHVYPRAPARTTARRSNPRSRKGRPRSRAAREQYVHHSPSLSLSRSRQSLYPLTSFRLL
jgi:hypothetical protein